MEVPTPSLLVRRSQPEGIETKSTKGRHSRRVRLANRVLPIVLEMAEGKKASDLLFTTDAGSTLHRTPITRSLKWEETGQGRRDPRPSPHRRVPVAVSSRRPRDRPGMDGSRVDRDHESLPPLPRQRRPRVRARPAERGAETAPQKNRKQGPGTDSEEGSGATGGTQGASEGE